MPLDSVGVAIGFRVMPLDSQGYATLTLGCDMSPNPRVTLRSPWAVDYRLILGLRYAYPRLWTIALSGRGGFLIFHF